jgi:hypothetical protein
LIAIKLGIQRHPDRCPAGGRAGGILCFVFRETEMVKAEPKTGALALTYSSYSDSTVAVSRLWWSSNHWF